MSEEMKAELNAFRDEVRQEFKGFRSEMREVREAVRDLADSVRRLAFGYASLDGRVSGIEVYMKEKLVTRDEFHSRMDAFSGRLTDSQLHWAHQKERTDDHDRRLTKLEERPH